MGANSAKPAPSGFLESDWNSMLRNLRFMGHDEVGLETQRELNNMKAYLNSKLTLTEKFKNSDAVSEVLCSHMFTCNDLNFCFGPSERKFTAIDITDKRLLTLWNEKKITEFRKRLEEDEEFIAQLGWYFYRYETKISAYDNGYKGPKFWELLFKSLPAVNPLKAFLIEYFKGMSDEPESEYSIIAKFNKTVGASGRKTIGFSGHIRNWLSEFDVEAMPLVKLYKFEGTNMVRKVGGVEQEVPEVLDDFADL
jgi:hypothetical protein